MMLLGMTTCIVAFKVWQYWNACHKRDSSEFCPQTPNPLIWVVPAVCDMSVTALLYIALTWTHVASFQMLRGSVIIFTGLISVAFLGTKLSVRNWVGMFTVTLGLVLVAIGDYVFFRESAHLEKNTVLAGDLLIIVGMGITAIMATCEERNFRKYNVSPLQSVGWEGIWGFSILTVLLFPMFFIPWHLPAGQDFWQDRPRFEDSIDGLKQIFSSNFLLISALLFIVNTALFNFSRLTVTKTMNATTSLVLDSVRTIFIWAFSLIVGWQKFEPLQPIGYLIVFIGICIYYNLIFVPLFKWSQKKIRTMTDVWHGFDINDEKQPLLASKSTDKDASLFGRQHDESAVGASSACS